MLFCFELGTVISTMNVLVYIFIYTIYFVFACLSADLKGSFPAYQHCSLHSNRKFATITEINVPVFPVRGRWAVQGPNVVFTPSLLFSQFQAFVFMKGTNAVCVIERKILWTV